MKRKIFIYILVIALILPLISLSAFAAVDDDDYNVFGFFDVLGAIWDSIKGVISAIGDGISIIVASIANGITAIGNFFTNLILAIGNAISIMLDGLRLLFVPRDNYFPNLQNKIYSSFNKKFGGVVYVSDYFKNRFSSLGSRNDTANLFVAKFPQGGLMGGFSFDVLGSVRNYIPFIRSVFSGFVTLMTVALCYRKTVSLINT